MATSLPQPKTEQVITDITSGVEPGPIIDPGRKFSMTAAGATQQDFINRASKGASRNNRHMEI